MSAVERAERGFHRALALAGAVVTLRRVTGAAGAYDVATGLVAAGTPQEIRVPAIMADETVRLQDGAIVTRRVASIPARLIEKYFGENPWGKFPWGGELPITPQAGDEIEEDGSAPQRVVNVDPTRLNGRVIFYRAPLAGGAA